MTNQHLSRLILVLVCTYNSWANTQEDLNIESAKLSPEIVSAEGKSKIRDHLQTLVQNINLTETNLLSTRKNINVIEAEIKELEELTEEHLTLKKRYTNFLVTAEKEITKNKKALADIQRYETKMDSLNKETLSPTQLNEIQTAKSEKQKRLTWQNETEQKKNKISELATGIEKNLSSIEARKLPLKEQLETWNKRLAEYQSILDKLKERKQTAERFLASQKVAPKNQIND